MNCDAESAVVSELDRVADNVRDDLLESEIVSYLVVGERLADRGRKSDAFAVDGGFIDSAYIVNQFVKIECPRAVLRPVGIELRVVENVVKDVEQRFTQLWMVSRCSL